jgi:hypothetical protein
MVASEPAATLTLAGARPSEGERPPAHLEAQSCTVPVQRLAINSARHRIMICTLLNSYNTGRTHVNP